MLGDLHFQLTTNSRRSVFISGLDFMNLIIIGLKLSMLHENNREIFLVRPVKYFVSQASYDPHIKSYGKYSRNKKVTVGETAVRLTNAHFLSQELSWCLHYHSFTWRAGVAGIGYYVEKPLLKVHVFKNIRCFICFLKTSGNNNLLSSRVWRGSFKQYPQTWAEALSSSTLYRPISL